MTTAGQSGSAPGPTVATSSAGQTSAPAASSIPLTVGSGMRAGGNRADQDASSQPGSSPTYDPPQTQSGPQAGPRPSVSQTGIRPLWTAARAQAIASDRGPSPTPAQGATGSSASTPAQATISSSAPVAATQAASAAPTAQATSHAEAPLAGVQVSLPRTVEAVRATVELAARQGISQARIQLSPASLGGVRIQLRQTSSGLVARIVADHADAAETLAQGGDDLRRSLQQAGIPLARLEIEASDQQGAQASNRDPGAGAGGQQQAGDDQDGDAVGGIPVEPGISAPAAGLVNVLA